MAKDFGSGVSRTLDAAWRQFASWSEDMAYQVRKALGIKEVQRGH